MFKFASCHFRFPFKRPEILKLWIAAVRRENWYPSKTSKLCGKHFVESDYLIKPGCTAKLLKPDAVPSVFLFPKHLMKKVPLPRRKILKKVRWIFIFFICNKICYLSFLE